MSGPGIAPWDVAVLTPPSYLQCRGLWAHAQNCKGNFPIYMPRFVLALTISMSPSSRLTVVILSFRTDRPGQTVQTQTRLRSSLIRVYTVCHSVCIVWTHYSMVEPHSSNFRVITTIFLVSEYLGNLRYTGVLHGEIYAIPQPWYRLH